MSQQEPVQFIDKLQKMMENYGEVISWNDNETQIVIKDVKKMANQVIPAYFRHTKYESFVRQLNMYNFHKVCRQKNNTINFKNDLFFKGNEQNFFKIKRKKKQPGKYDNQGAQQQIKLIQSHVTLPQYFKDLIIKLIEYKSQALNHNSKLKSFFSQIGNDLRTPKFKKFDKDISQMKSIIQNIYDRSETIDEQFNSSKKVQTQSTIHPYPSYQQKLDQALGNHLIKSTIVGHYDYNAYNSQVSMQRLQQPNTNIPIFKTKINFMDVLPQQHWQNENDDRLSMCSIENDLD